jgi:hypothetical protein
MRTRMQPLTVVSLSHTCDEDERTDEVIIYACRNDLYFEALSNCFDHNTFLPCAQLLPSNSKKYYLLGPSHCRS